MGDIFEKGKLKKADAVPEVDYLERKKRLHSSIGYANPGVVYGSEKYAPSYFLGKFIKKARQTSPVDSVENTTSCEASSSFVGCLPHSQQGPQQPQQLFY